MFEYVLVLCMFAGNTGSELECKPSGPPMYDREECIRKMSEQAMTNGIAACRVRYMEEIFDAPDQQGPQDQASHEGAIRT